MNEQISIIVPVYNAEKTLHRCVSSLMEQTYAHIEILLVNDGSRDRSLELCQSLTREDARIRVIDKPNGGVSSARNAGLDAAQGDFVMFCDSDDWVDPDWCRFMLEHYVPDGLTVCEIFREDIPRTEHHVPEEIVPRKNYLHHQMLMCSPVNKIFSRAVIETNSLRFSRELSLGEDFVFCLHYLCSVSGDIRFVYRDLYYYDTTNDNTLSKRAPALEQCEKFYQAVTEAMAVLEIEDKESFMTRDFFVAPHFERCLNATAGRKELSFKEKIVIAARIGKMEAFRNTCRNGMRWGNPLYVYFYRHGYARAAMVFLLLRNQWKD